jgi:hypothetical protein
VPSIVPGAGPFGAGPQIGPSNPHYYVILMRRL